MASVRKRKWTHNGVEKEAWIVSYTDQGGKRRIKTFDKKKDADRYRTQVETELTDKTHTAWNESLTIEDGVRSFMKDMEQRNKTGDIEAASTLDSYRNRLENHLSAKLGKLKISEVTAEMVQKIIDSQIIAEYKPNTIVSFYATVVTFLKFAVRKRWVRRNVLLDEPCRVPRRTKRVAVPTREDISKLLRALETKRPYEQLRTYLCRRLIVSLGLFCGLRPGEVFGLQWEDIDLENHVMKIRHSYSRKGGLKGTKTQAGMRAVPLPPLVETDILAVARFSAIHQWANDVGFESYTCHAVHGRIKRAWVRKDFMTDFPDLKGFVLLNHDGKPMTHSNANHTWKTVMNEAGLIDPKTQQKKFTPHALRHAAASLLIEAGLPAINLKTVIGHSSISTTYDVYGHLFPDDTKTADTINSIADRLTRTAFDCKNGMGATTEQHSFVSN